MSRGNKLTTTINWGAKDIGGIVEALGTHLSKRILGELTEKRPIDLPHVLKATVAAVSNPDIEESDIDRIINASVVAIEALSCRVPSDKSR